MRSIGGSGTSRPAETGEVGDVRWRPAEIGDVVVSVVTPRLPDSKETRKHWEKSICSFGSGPRGRWFKSTRPDQFLKNPRKSAQFSLAVHSVLVRKSGRENRVLRTSNGVLLRNCSTFGYDRPFSGSNLYAHLMLIAASASAT